MPKDHSEVCLNPRSAELAEQRGVARSDPCAHLPPRLTELGALLHMCVPPVHAQSDEHLLWGQQRLHSCCLCGAARTTHATSIVLVIIVVSEGAAIFLVLLRRSFSGVDGRGTRNLTETEQGAYKARMRGGGHLVDGFLGDAFDGRADDTIQVGKCEWDGVWVGIHRDEYLRNETPVHTATKR